MTSDKYEEEYDAMKMMIMANIIMDSGSKANKWNAWKNLER